MNISKFRNSYLIDKTYRLTLVSVTLTALAPLIATLVDGLFSSNLLGNDAFISVSVALPLVNAVSVLTMICERGGSVLAAGQLAKGNRDKANRIYTAAIASAVLVAVVAAVGIWINLDSMALGLTGRPESAAYAREYLQVIVIYLLILPLNNTFNDFATQEGFPQLATRAVAAGSAANVVLDILFIGVLGMGISGAAWGMLGLSKVSAEAMWLGMIVGGVPILVASLAYGYREHLRHPLYTKFSLVDKMLTCIKFECSIDYEQHNLDEMKKMIKLFAVICEMSDEVRSKMYSTIQALLDNAQERRTSHLKYLDISLSELDDGVQMTIKDCGRPYDPVHNGMDAASIGARSATYRYMFTMNVTTIVWNINGLL